MTGYLKTRENDAKNEVSFMKLQISRAAQRLADSVQRMGRQCNKDKQFL